MRNRTLRATWRGLETWNGRDTGRTGAPVLDPTCERLPVRYRRGLPASSTSAAKRPANGHDELGPLHRGRLKL